MRQLTGQDASFLYTETPNTPSLGAGLNIYDPSTAPGGFVRFKDILAAYERRLHLAKYMRSRLVRVPMDLDHPYWVEDPDFDLEFHVRHIALPKPGDWRQLCIQTARLLARPLDLSHPPWEVYVIEGLDNIEGLPNGSFAIFSKIHHAATDGAAGMEITNIMHDLEADADSPEPAQEWTPERVPTSWELMSRAQFNHAMLPMRFAETIGRSFSSSTPLNPVNPFVPFAAPPSMQARVPSRVPRTRFNGNVSPHRVVDGRRLSLAAIRETKQAVDGATVNDVVLTIVGGALRSYLEANDDLPDEPLVAMAPVSIRAKPMSAEGNEVAALYVPIGTHIADPLERLSAVRHDTSEQKLMLEAIDAPNLVALSVLLPGGLSGVSNRLVAQLGVEQPTLPFGPAPARPDFNTVVTNVPGPQVPLYFAGSRLLEMWGFGPLTNIAGLFHSVQSYCGTVYLAVTACPKMLPDPAVYTQCLQDAYDTLTKAAETRPKPSKRAPSRATRTKRATGTPRTNAKRAADTKRARSGTRSADR